MIGHTEHSETIIKVLKGLYKHYIERPMCGFAHCLAIDTRINVKLTVS